MLIGRYSVLSKHPGRNIGGAGNLGASRFDFNKTTMGRQAFTSSSWQPKSGIPDGLRPPYGWVLPLKDGALSARKNQRGVGTFSPAIAGGVNGVAALSGVGALTASGALIVSLVAALTGSGTISSAAALAYLQLAASLAGAGDVDGALVALGHASAALSGAGDADATSTALGELIASIIVTGDVLNTANVGSAVWGAIAASNNNAGTMGEKLNLASAGGVDYGALADAVWEANTADYTGETMTGYRLQRCGWDIQIPGSFGSGRAGYILGNLMVSMPSVVWEASASGSNTPGTMGEQLNLAAFGVVDYATVASTVWAALLEDNVEDASFGQAINAILTFQDSIPGAVWDVDLGSHASSGTTGEALSNAGLAGDPWTKVIESGYTAEEILRLLAAVAQGNATGLENGNPVFKSIDGGTDRIEATYVDGVRVVTNRDAT